MPALNAASTSCFIFCSMGGIRFGLKLAWATHSLSWILEDDYDWVMPLAAYYYGGGEKSNALVLGFGSCSAAAIRTGMWRLAAAIDAAR